jgi:hypothetical protein
MQKVTDLINQNLTGQTKLYSPNTPNYVHSEQVFDFVWRGLQAGRFIGKDEIIGGMDYKYWRKMLNDLTDEQLTKGFKATDNFKGFLTWSEFKTLCIDSCKTTAAYKHFLKIPEIKATIEQNKAGMAELRRVTGV